MIFFSTATESLACWSGSVEAEICNETELVEECAVAVVIFFSKATGSSVCGGGSVEAESCSVTELEAQSLGGAAVVVIFSCAMATWAGGDGEVGWSHGHSLATEALGRSGCVVAVVIFSIAISGREAVVSSLGRARELVMVVVIAALVVGMGTCWGFGSLLPRIGQIVLPETAWCKKPLILLQGAK